MPLTNIRVNDIFMFGVLILRLYFFVNLFFFVDYVSKYIAVKSTHSNETKVILDFIKTHMFEIPKPYNNHLS